MPGRYTWYFRIRPPPDKPVATVIPTDDDHHYTPLLLPGTGNLLFQHSKFPRRRHQNKSPSQ